MSTPVLPAVKYAYHAVTGTWDYPGLPSLDAGTLPPPTGAWDPTQLSFIERPTGANYVTIESTGQPSTGAGIRAAVLLPALAGKILTLPAGTFEFIDYAQGDGGVFMHGLFQNNASGCRGIVGSGAGTILQMQANSSHFNASTTVGPGSALQGTTPNQFLCSTIQFYQVNNVEFGNLVVQGTAQPHLNHGVRINSNNAYVHHLRFLGASMGSFNQPPGETYSLMVSGTNPVLESIELDGRRTSITSAVTSTLIGILGCTNATLNQVYGHDTLSGFVMVQYVGAGFTSNDMWAYRMGSSTGGYNGCHSNHELAGGPFRHNRPHIVQDAFWVNPIINGVKKFPGNPDPRSQGKFGHMILLEYANGTTHPNANAYADFKITEPVFDTWGGLTGGFALSCDPAITAYPQVIKNGVTLTPVVRNSWWLDSPAIDVTHQYWIAGTTGNASTWG